MTEALNDLDPFIGRWRLTSRFSPDDCVAPRSTTTFDWLPGSRIVIQRWEVEHPDAPDGIAIIGFDSSGSSHLQHYFGRRGVARVDDTEFTNGVWTLQRFEEHPGFSQRFVGRFNEDRRSVVGRWEIFRDRGSNWTPDFDLTCTKVDEFCVSRLCSSGSARSRAGTMSKSILARPRTPTRLHQFDDSPVGQSLHLARAVRELRVSTSRGPLPLFRAPTKR